MLLVLPPEFSTPADAGASDVGSTVAAPASAPAPVIGSLPAATSPGGWSPTAATTVGSTASSARVRPVVALRTVSALTTGGIPSVAFTAYTRAAAAVPAVCRLRWSLLAAIGRVESDHGRFGGATLQVDGVAAPPIIGLPLNGAGTALVADTDHGRLDGDAAYDHAVGPMQFIPSTWARYASDGNGDSSADPFNVYDAALAAARYLCTAGGDLGSAAGQARAVLAYNHSASYVATVLTLAAAYGGTPPPKLAVLPPAPPTAPPANPAPPPAIGVAAATHRPTGSATPATSTTAGRSTAASSTTGSSTSASSMTSGSETSGSTTGSSTTAGSTTAGSTSGSSSSAGSTTTASSTTSGSTTASSTTSGSTTASSTTTPSTTTAPTTAPSTTTAPTTTSCPAPAAQATVDVVNETGQAAVGTDVAAHLTAAGLLVGGVTSTAGSTATALEYPAAQLAQARSLAAALGTPAYLREAAVEHITVVLRADDMGPLVTAVDALPAATCGH